MKYDTEGRQFMAIHDVRNSVFSAAATLTTGTASQLIPGDTDYFTDIIELSFANQSTVGAQINIVNDGTIIRQFEAGAGVTTHLKFDVPMKQLVKNTPIFVDMEDITGTTVLVDALFIKKTTL